WCQRQPASRRHAPVTAASGATGDQEEREISKKIVLPFLLFCCGSTRPRSSIWDEPVVRLTRQTSRGGPRCRDRDGRGPGRFAADGRIIRRLRMALLATAMRARLIGGLGLAALAAAGAVATRAPFPPGGAPS